MPLYIYQDATVKANNNTLSIGEDSEELELLYTAGGNEKMENNTAVPQKTKNRIAI